MIMYERTWHIKVGTVRNCFRDKSSCWKSLQKRLQSNFFLFLYHSLDYFYTIVSPTDNLLQIWFIPWKLWLCYIQGEIIYLGNIMFTAAYPMVARSFFLWKLVPGSFTSSGIFGANSVTKILCFYPSVLTENRFSSFLDH